MLLSPTRCSVLIFFCWAVVLFQATPLSTIMSNEQGSTVVTVAYKTVNEQDVLLDLYPPDPLAGPLLRPSVPAIIYFHGGGLTVGNRQSWFPGWLQSECIKPPSLEKKINSRVYFLERMSACGYAFVSVDYRLMPSGGITGHEILQDVRDVFAFLRRPDLEFILPDGRVLKVDGQRLAVAGTSAGGTCAYLAATHVEPRPKAVLSMYGMGGNFLVSSTVCSVIVTLISS